MGANELDLFGDRNKSGLTLQQLENLMSDIRYQPKWREEADKCCDYYDGHQLTQERLARMERLGIPPLVTNLIAPAINAVLGMEAKTRTDWRVTEQDDANMAPEPLMNAMNAKLNEAERESRADRAISDGYASQSKAGLGWVEVARASDPFAYPYRVQHVHRREIWWDWRAKQPDLSDARYLVRKRRFDCDELIAMMPQHADLIRWATDDRFRTWQWDLRTIDNNDLAYAIHVERITNLDDADWRDSDRRRATLYEVWYRQKKRGKVLRLPDRRVVEFDPRNPRHQMAVSNGWIAPVDAVFDEVRVAFYMGPHRLYDMPSPYKHRHFPYVPFWAFREDRSGVPYGLIRAMLSPQDVVNSADAKMHWLLNAKRTTMDHNALHKQSNTIRQVQDELNRPDAFVILDGDHPNARFKVENEFTLEQQQFNRRMQAASDIENAGGIYKAMLGKEGAATSGIAINSLVEQGNIMLSEINDNYAFARRQVGELLFSLVREDLMAGEIAVGIRKGKQRSVIYLNRRTVDPETQQPAVENDVSAVPTKVVLEDVPSTPAFRAQQLQILSDVTKSLPPQVQAVLIPMVIGLTDIPNKDEAVSLVRKAVGLPDQDLTPEDEKAMQDDAAQKQAAAEQLMAEDKIADIKLKDAKTEETVARADKLKAETATTMNPPVEPPPPSPVAWQ